MQITGIVIKKQATNEYDQIVTIYTREAGKLTAVARSSLKPSSIQGMHLDLFNLIECDLVEGRGWPIVTGAQGIASHFSIKANLLKNALAFFFAEATDKLTAEGDHDEKLWEFISETYSDLDRHEGDVKHLRTWFKNRQMGLLAVLGYQPDTERCALCGSERLGQHWVLTEDSHGLVCGDCFLAGQGGGLIRGQTVASGSIYNGLFQAIAESPFESLRLLQKVISDQ